MKNKFFNELIIVCVSVLCISVMLSYKNDTASAENIYVDENAVCAEKLNFNDDYINNCVLCSSICGSGELYKEVFLDSSLYTPVRGILTSTFGESRNGYFHKGIDLAANTGTEIGAAMDGRVSYSGQASGYGNVVYIEHQGNRQTRYAHCSELDVKTGDYVVKGQTIAKVGSTGDSTGPHLHFEIRVNGSPVDPLNYRIDAVEY